MATVTDIIHVLAEELGFVVEPLKSRLRHYIIRRPSKNPSYKTQYTTMWIKGETCNIEGYDQVKVLLCDPRSIEQLVELIEKPGVLMGSHKSIDDYIGDRLDD
jgi:hypothetical protein